MRVNYIVTPMAGAAEPVKLDHINISSLKGQVR